MSAHDGTPSTPDAADDPATPDAAGDPATPGAAGDPATPVARDPRAEAQRVAGDRFDARVLEPSPPAVLDGEWFADDPPAVGTAATGRPVLAPVPGTGPVTWDQWLAARPTPTRSPPSAGPPASCSVGRPTPPGPSSSTCPRQAPPTRRSRSTPSLPVDPVAAAFLGDWYGFAWSVLEELRADAASVEASRVQLWPEHLDAAFECFPAERRATFGASPGDAAVSEPYLYVLPPHGDAVAPSELWNADSFRGAILPLGEFVDAADQRAACLSFLRQRRSVLEP